MDSVLYNQAVEILYPATPDLTADQQRFLTAFLTPFVEGKIAYGLFGECGTGPYRAQLLAGLLARNPEIKVYNPDKGPGMWTPADNLVEEVARQFVLADFYYLDQSRGLVSALEAGAVAFFRNVSYAITLSFETEEIAGQVVSKAQRRLINQLRSIARCVAEINGRPMYGSLEEASEKMPVDYLSLQAYQHRTATEKAKKETRQLIRDLGYGRWLRAKEIVITDHPFQAQLEVMVAILVAYSRLESMGSLFIHVPDETKWENLVIDGELIIGRLYKDLARSLQPYLRRLVTLAPCPTYILGL